MLCFTLLKQEVALAFEKFRSHTNRKPHYKIAVVTITPNGLLTFNSQALREFTLSAYSHSVLYFDRTNRKVALEFVTDSSLEGATRLTFKGSAVRVYARPFLKFFEIMFDETRVFSLSNLAERKNWVTFDLSSTPVTPVKRRGKPLV